MSQQWPPQQPPEGGQANDPYGQPAQPNPYGQPGQPSQYGQPNPYGQYGPPSQYGQPGQPGQFGQSGQSAPPSQGFPPPGGGYPSYPAYPGQQPGTWGPPSQYGAGQYPTGYPQPGFGAPPPQQSRGWVAPLIIGIIVLLVLGGGGTVFALTRSGNSVSSAPTATLAPTATSTPGAPVGFKLYTDSGGVFSLDVPDSWESDSSSSLTTFESASTESAFEIEYLGVPLGGQSDEAADGFFNAVGTTTNRTGPTNVSIAGETWSKYEGDVDLAGTPEHLVLLITGHSDSTALIAYLAPNTTFSSVDSQYFQTMLQSFKFLK